jgi:hypothetical protein
MTSADPIPTTLTANLQRLGLAYAAETLNYRKREAELTQKKRRSPS